MRIVRQPRIWLFLGVMLCQFALFEAGLRLKGGSEAAPAFQRLFTPDPNIGYRLKPNARTRFKTASFDTEISINSSGTRDDEIGPKAANERRIVVLGDSLVMAVQVPLQQTFCKRLEDLLNTDPALAPYRYRVINAGVQGYGPVEELLFYQHIAARFEPDVVLLTLFVGNDAVEAIDGVWRLGGANGPAFSPKTTQPLARQAMTWIRRTVRRSMVLQVARLRLRMLADSLGHPATPSIERPLSIYLPQPPEDIMRGLDVTRECVTRLAATAAARGTRTGVILMPARLQLNDTDFGNLTTVVEQNGERLVRNAATDRFKSALAGLPVPVMDALPPLYDAPRHAETFFEDTVHLTPRGHQVVAQALEAFLLHSGLLATPAAVRASKGDR